MPGLRTIPIYTEDIVRGTKYMMDKEGRLDLIGQILHTGFGVKIHEHIETPAHQNTILFPFTEAVRGRANNTPLTMAILKNANRYSPLKQLDLANDLLEEYDLYLEQAE